MSEQMKENKMAIMPVKELLLKMGLPIILSMMMQAAYNIVDSIFVGNIEGDGEAALNALTLAFPIQMLMVAVGIGTGVGVGALLSNFLGQKNKERASKVAGNAMFLAAVIYLVCLLFGIFGVKAFVASQTSNPLVTEFAIQYLRICCTLSAGLLCFNMMEKMLQATGRSIYSTIAQIAGALTNIVLDPIMIFGFFGLPKMGVVGAAWATVIGQFVSAILGVLFHLQKNKEISNRLSYWKPDGNIIRGIYAIGLPAIIAQALMSIMTYGLNLILGGISESAVTAYGLYYKIQQFILFAAFGLRDAITPTIAFNRGLGDRKRVEEGIKYGMLYTIVIMVIGTALLELLATPFTQLFGLSGETRDMCISAMRIISLSFVFAGVNVASQGIFQALEGGLESLIISVCRQILFILPVAYFFAGFARADIGNLWMVWLTFPIGEGITALIAMGLMKRVKKRQIIDRGKRD